MTDKIKRKFPQLGLATSLFSEHFAQLHFYGSLTLTSMQYYANDSCIAEKFNIASSPHILTHFPTEKNNSSKALTNWQFDKKTAQVLNLYFITIKIAQL